MGINWKLRLKNKTTLTTLAITVIAAVYSILSILGVVPSIAQEQITNLAITIITLLAALGIVVDPTTQGVGDSVQAMEYEEPKISIEEDE